MRFHDFCIILFSSSSSSLYQNQLKLLFFIKPSPNVIFAYAWKITPGLVVIAVAKCVAHVQIITYNAFLYTVEPLLADTPNSGPLPYNGQYAMYQLLFPYIYTIL